MIVITGGTGFVGREVVKQALADGHRVRLIVRDAPPARSSAWPDGVEWFHGNVLYAPSLEGAFAGAKAVVHLVGIINEWKENTFDRAHRQATVNVVDAAKRAGVKRYVHMSALGTRADARSRYHQTKWAAEEYVRASGLAWTIFRPSLIYGAQDISTTVLARMIRRAPFIPVIGAGNTKIQPVAVEVVAKCFVAALRTDESIQKVFEVVGPEPLTWNELFDALQSICGVKKRKLHLPIPVARLQGALFERLMPKPPLNREQVTMAQEDNVGDPRPAERMFLFTQEPFAQGLARYLQN
jgi:NADH dehydrogenase